MKHVKQLILSALCACCIACAFGLVAPQQAQALQPVSLSDEMKYFAKYESSQNYGQTLSSGDGYNAMGYYQFDRRYGLRDFIEECYESNPGAFKAFGDVLKAYTESDFKNKPVYDFKKRKFTPFGLTLNASWRVAMSYAPKDFPALQDAYAYKSYYLPVQRSLASRGIDISGRADCVKGLCWGMSNLFGPTGCMYFFNAAGLSAGMSDREFARAVCNAVVSKVAARYPSQPEYHEGWQNRYRKELKDCLFYLGDWSYEDGGWKFLVRGVPLTGEWEELDDIWYYFDDEGHAVEDRWAMVGSKWYLFDEDCHMLTGWQKPGSSWYYLGSDGAMRQSWQKISYGGTTSWYYFRPGNSGGQMMTGLNRIVYDGETRSFLFSSGGRMLTGWQKEDGRWYFLAGSGAALTGWQELEYNGITSWFYFDGEGAMQTGWLDYRNRRYFMLDSGRMLTGWQDLEGHRYRFSVNGAMATGWHDEGGQSYYFDPQGRMARGWADIGRSRYLFDDQGRRLSGWQERDGFWYYLGNDGVMSTRWEKIRYQGEDRWFFFDGEGRMLTGLQTIRYDGRDCRFLFAGSGAMLTGWQTVDGVSYYFDGNGVMQEPASAKSAGFIGEDEAAAAPSASEDGAVPASSGLVEGPEAQALSDGASELEEEALNAGLAPSAKGPAAGGAPAASLEAGDAAL